MANELTETDRFVFFWDGWPSQWFSSPFLIDCIHYNCCEQFMMAEKARVFGDDDRLRQILTATSPREQKALGRKITGFDAPLWNRVCRGIVYRGNVAKFSQNDLLRDLLLQTGDKTIVEASPTDPIWGIGLAAGDPRAHDPSAWRGTNWLGIALMQARGALRDRAVGIDAHLDEPLRQQLDERETIARRLLRS